MNGPVTLVCPVLVGRDELLAIAEELGIASRTVASHVEHILDKLGAERRSEIAAWAATVSADRTPT